MERSGDFLRGRMLCHVGVGSSQFRGLIFEAEKVRVNKCEGLFNGEHAADKKICCGKK